MLVVLTGQRAFHLSRSFVKSYGKYFQRRHPNHTKVLVLHSAMWMALLSHKGPRALSLYRHVPGLCSVYFVVTAAESKNGYDGSQTQVLAAASLVQKLAMPGARPEQLLCQHLLQVEESLSGSALPRYLTEQLLWREAEWATASQATSTASHHAPKSGPTSTP